MPAHTATSWETLFARHRIAEHVAAYGFFRITASEINTVREARLMAKFDVKQSLPAIFRTHHLSILPISRGEYCIGPYQTHQDITYQHYPTPRPLAIPALDTLAVTDIHSEAEAMLVLQNSGALRQVFASDTIYPTLQGRRGSGQFDFQIACTRQPTQTIQVNNAQIEIDAGFETATHIFLCESKNVLVHDLLIRQLYYPYRFVAQKSHKTIVPVSIIYNNYTYYITRYTVGDHHDYNSLQPAQHFAYTLDTQPFRMDDIALIWQQSTPCIINDIPFPQADDLRIVLSVVRVLATQSATKTDITSVLGYDKRQTDYYVNAAYWLGFVDGQLRITPLGKQVVTAAPHQQKRLVIQAIFATPFFYDMGKIIITHTHLPSKEDIAAAMAHHDALHKLSGETLTRRAQTVLAWLRWIRQQITD